MAELPPGVDPRPAPGERGPAAEPGPEAAFGHGAALRPAVAGAGLGANAWPIVAASVLLGLLVFLWLASHRTHAPRDMMMSPEAATTPLSAPPPPPEVEAMQAAARAPPAAPPPAVAVVTPPPPAPVKPPPPAPAAAPTGRAPVLVVDLAGPSQSAEAAPQTKPAAGKATDAAARAAAANLNGDEQFAARFDNAEAPERARATMLRDQDAIAPQGTIIPAVLETALNSDLPGYARAVVSRDVRSFDGSTVLIPRGSRVIGEYRSAVALGQSRVFVIWTRVLRPDGGSIQIGSGGGDLLGRAGLGGQVDHHFFERFSGAVLLTVLNAGATALAGTPSTEVVVGSSQAATGLAGSAAAFAPAAIAPTIKVAQGTPIRIFVSRDLDFTSVARGGP